MAKEQVILVDESDNSLGTLEKMEAHLRGVLHRAVSVLILNSRGEMLLQQRALGKYHTPGLWSNACCSHPREGEQALEAASRRLKEEMGMECHLEPYFSFIYRADFDNGLVEHEFDHVFMGISDEEPQINPGEVNAFRYMPVNEMTEDMKAHPQLYTAWFHIILQRMAEMKPGFFHK